VKKLKMGEMQAPQIVDNLSYKTDKYTENPNIRSSEKYDKIHSVTKNDEFNVIPKGVRNSYQSQTILESPTFVYKRKDDSSPETRRSATQIQMRNSIDDNAINGYEMPIFIHKKENEIELERDSLVSEDPPVDDLNMKNSISKDIERFTAQFENTRDKEERIQICNNYYK
jgi:hypothetical protein